MHQKNNQRLLRYKTKLLLSIYHLNESNKSPGLYCQIYEKNIEKFSYSIYHLYTSDKSPGLDCQVRKRKTKKSFLILFIIYIKVINHQDFNIKLGKKHR